jgi:aminopeptidase
MLDRYAEILVSHAVGLRPGQDLFIRGQDIQHDFGLRVGQAAYALGARSVHYHFPKAEELKQLLSLGSFEQISLYHEDVRAYFAEILKRNAALICLASGSEEPRWLEEIRQSNPGNHGIFMQGMSKASIAFHEYIKMHLFPHTIAPVANRRWACTLFPGDSDQLKRLWELIFCFCSADQKDFGTVLAERRRVQQARMEKLDRLAIREIRITGNGNHLTLGISSRAQWVGSTLETNAKQAYYPNFPANEIFTTPDCRTAHGRLVASQPFRLFNQVLVKGLALEFRQGQIVDFDAREGRDAFASWIETDAGSRFLGEIGLVGGDSPIHGAGIYFDFVNLDENLASHLALGNSLPYAISNSERMSERELSSLGCNKSMIHTDIMFGSPGVNVIASKTNRGEVLLLEGGRWSEAV